MTTSTQLRTGRTFAFGPVAAGLATAVFLMPTLAAAGQSGNRAEVTFTKDVAPILQRSCQSCHRPGSVAPMSLITYEDVRPWARAVKQKTRTREMPPWFIEKNVGVRKV